MGSASQSQAGHDHIGRSAIGRELDPLCGSQEGNLRIGGVWAGHDWICPAFRLGSPDDLQQHLVLGERQDSCDSRHELGKPFRRSRESSYARWLLTVLQIGQLVGPFIATEPDKIPSLTLYVAVIVSLDRPECLFSLKHMQTTICVLPTPFIPAAPPLPPSLTALPRGGDLDWSTIRRILLNPAFHLIAWAFTIYVAAFNATSSLLNQILEPYDFSEDDAGIVGAVLIFVGLGAAAVASPILDRFPKLRIPCIQLCVLLISSMYLALIFVPEASTLAAPLVVCVVLGGASFVILPLALETLVQLCAPVGPEVSSTMCWSLSQLLGGVLIVAMDALRSYKTEGSERGMYKSLILQSVLCWVVAPPPLAMGWLLKTGRIKL